MNRIKKTLLFSRAWDKYEKKCDTIQAPYNHYRMGFLAGWSARKRQIGAGKTSDNILRNEALHIIEAIDKLDLIKLDIHMCELLKWWKIQKEIEKEFSGKRNVK